MKGKLFFPICTGALMVALTVIGIFGLLGYRLIEGVVVYLLFGLLVTLALGGLSLWLVRRIQKNGLRILAGTVLVLAVSAVVLLMFSFFSFVNSFYTYQPFTILESESGREVAVMRIPSQEFADERCSARGGETIAYEDLAYEYRIYPVFSKFFYNSKNPAEGELEIGCGSKAVLMHQWEGDSLRMYIQDPEEFDVGELLLQ